MKAAFGIIALAGAVAAIPAGVTSAISPKSTDPAGCTSSYDGKFEISVVNVTSSSTKRSTALVVSLADGTLTDAQGRTGYIASNYQFQFDAPAQAGAIYTSGWSACSNGTLALGDSAIFYQCLSGTFYNLYDESTGAQCSEVYIDIVPMESTATSTVASQGSDGQVTETPVVSQITDGQIQASTGLQVVSQISDGQIQATTGVAVVTQISDGQIQATTGAVVTQISDGQIQATTGAVVTQISDGQIQATTAAAVVTQISDGQIQATTGVAVVTQISDGQIQATANGTGVAAASATIQPYTGAAALPTLRAELFGLAAGVLALAAL